MPKFTVELQKRVIESWTVEADTEEHAADLAVKASGIAARNAPDRGETDFPQGRRWFAEVDEDETDVLEVVEGEGRPE